MDPDEVVSKFRFDEAIDFIQWLFKTRRTEFPHHLPFVEPSEVATPLSTGAFTVFLCGLLKDLERFSRLLNFGENSNCIGFLTQQDVTCMRSSDGHSIIPMPTKQHRNRR